MRISVAGAPTAQKCGSPAIFPAFRSQQEPFDILVALRVLAGGISLHDGGWRISPSTRDSFVEDPGNFSDGLGGPMANGDQESLPAREGKGSRRRHGTPLGYRC